MFRTNQHFAVFFEASLRCISTKAGPMENLTIISKRALNVYKRAAMGAPPRAGSGLEAALLLIVAREAESKMAEMVGECTAKDAEAFERYARFNRALGEAMQTGNWHFEEESAADAETDNFRALRTKWRKSWKAQGGNANRMRLWQLFGMYRRETPIKAKKQIEWAVAAIVADSLADQ